MFSDEKIQNVHLYFRPPGLQDTKASDGWGTSGPGENLGNDYLIILNFEFAFDTCQRFSRKCLRWDIDDKFRVKQTMGCSTKRRMRWLGGTLPGCDQYVEED